MRGEHQIHLLLAQRGVDLIRSLPLGNKTLDGAVGGLRGPAGNVVEASVALLHRRSHVFRDVVQVEHVGKGRGEQHRLLVAQHGELGGQILEVRGVLSGDELLAQLIDGDEGLVKLPSRWSP